MAIVLVITLIALATLYAFLPLWQRLTGETVERDFASAERERRLRQKADAYAAIKEAEFDYESGKLTDTDLEYLRNKFSQQAMEAIAALDDRPKAAVGGTKAGRVAFCPSCGKGVTSKAKFCGVCGKSLRELIAA